MYSKFMRKAGAAIMAAAMVLNGTAVSVGNVVAADEIKYEFEDATLTGTIAVDSDSKASGGKIAYMTEDGTITLEVEVASTGMYNLNIYAQGVGGAKTQGISINGIAQELNISEGTGTYSPVSLVTKLNEGKNEIVITKSWGWTKFDYLSITSAELAPISASQTTCCDTQATAETRALMSYLASVYGKNIISGQQEIYNYGPHDFETEFEYLKDKTGHYPAIRGFDYGNRCCVLFGQQDDGSTDRVIDWVKNKGGIATASFHLNVPNEFENYTLGSTLPFDQTTYSEKTDFSPSKACTEGTKENEYYLQALEVLAKDFKKLEAEGVPVMWRPLHEAEGGGGENGSWFWWGREGSEAYKKLWIYTYETLTEKFDCHNLIWIWNSYNFEYSQDWYPGDEYVDIIGYDKYNCTEYLAENGWKPSLVHNDSAISSVFYGLMDRYDSKKMIAMAENDCFSTVENLTSEKAGWLYFCTWYDGGSDNINFLSNPIFNTLEDTIEMYQSDYCITLDELPADLYSKDTPAPVSTSKTTADPSKTTTTTTVTTEADPSKNYGKVAFDKTTKSYTITLPEATDEFYVNIDMPATYEYVNGGMGLNVNVDGVDYWVNIKWESKNNGDIKVNVIDDFYNCSIGADVVEDEAVIEKVKAELGKSKTYTGQIWYAQENEKEAPTSEVKMISAYIKSESSDTTTTVEPTNPTDDVTVEPKLLGDANCDEKVNMADATFIIQHCGNKDKYKLTPLGAANADCDGKAGISGTDALAVQKLIAGVITSLPDNE